MIYLDNAATTRPFDNVTERMQSYYRTDYFNPSALYAPANAVADEIEKSRESIGAVLGGGGRVYFTSCATESNTWVFQSAVKNKKGNVVVSMGEHASGYENAQALAGKGMDVRFVKLLPDGRIDINDFSKKVDANTTLVSVIHCSNETGAVNDIAALAKAAKTVNPHVLVHSDGVQALAKIPFRCAAAGIDLYSVSAHKIGGPKGIGALWVREGIRLQPLLPGGGQEYGMRSGTENVAGIIGFATALQTFMQCDSQHVTRMRDDCIAFFESIPHTVCNLSRDASPYILSLSIEGIKAEIFQRKLAERDILIGLGSACSAKLRKNRILAAMGQSMPHIEGSMRISFCPQNTQEEIRRFLRASKECLTEMHRI